MASIFPTRSSVLAVDLTSAGAPASWQRDRDPHAETFIMGRLAGLAKLLDGAGADLLTTGAEFRLGGKRRRDEHLDGALAMARLGEHTRTARLVPTLPVGPAPEQAAVSVAAIHRATGGRGGWQVGPDTLALRPVAAALTGVPRVAVVAHVRTDVDVEIAAALADVARLRVDTVEEARNLRSALRAAAADWGREPGEITVLVDVRVVLGEDATSAEARALFIEEFDAVEAGLLAHVGTVTTMANVWQNWVRAGAADGFTVLPSSIPTDVVAVAAGLLPELDRRGLHAAPPATSAPTRRRRHPVAA